MLKSACSDNAVQTQLIDAPENSFGHVRTMLIVYGTSTKKDLITSAKCSDSSKSLDFVCVWVGDTATETDDNEEQQLAAVLMYNTMGSGLEYLHENVRNICKFK